MPKSNLTWNCKNKDELAVRESRSFQPGASPIRVGRGEHRRTERRGVRTEENRRVRFPQAMPRWGCYQVSVHRSSVPRKGNAFQSLGTERKAGSLGSRSTQ